jgi:IS30 family transposase
MRGKLPMRKISELLRQRHELKYSYRNIASSLNISISTVSDYLVRAKGAGISWPLPEGMSGDIYHPERAALFVSIRLLRFLV